MTRFLLALILFSVSIAWSMQECPRDIKIKVSAVSWKELQDAFDIVYEDDSLISLSKLFADPLGIRKEIIEKMKASKEDSDVKQACQTILKALPKS